MKRDWMKASTILAVTALLSTLAGCVPASEATDSQRSAPAVYDIAVTEQASDTIKVYDAQQADWSKKSALKWSWTPSAANGFAGLTTVWGLPTEAKVRKNAKWGGEWMVVTDSRGLAAIIPYPKGDSRKWGLDVGGNPHSAELLPNGNIAVAASGGSWVREYASSQGPSSKAYAEYGLSGAHGVLWDPGMNVLWAVGSRFLVALETSGTDAAPVLKERLKIDLPTPNAHAVEPVYGQSGKLWVASGSKVYQYDKAANRFELSYPGSEKISRVGVKSIGNQLSGQVIETVPDMAKKPTGACKTNNWCTDTVDGFGPDVTRTLMGTEIYKARILNPDYQ